MTDQNTLSVVAHGRKTPFSFIEDENTIKHYQLKTFSYTLQSVITEKEIIHNVSMTRVIGPLLYYINKTAISPVHLCVMTHSAIHALLVLYQACLCLRVSQCGKTPVQGEHVQIREKHMQYETNTLPAHGMHNQANLCNCLTFKYICIIKRLFAKYHF